MASGGKRFERSISRVYNAESAPVFVRKANDFYAESHRTFRTKKQKNPRKIKANSREN